MELGYSQRLFHEAIDMSENGGIARIGHPINPDETVRLHQLRVAEDAVLHGLLHVEPSCSTADPAEREGGKL